MFAPPHWKKGAHQIVPEYRDPALILFVEYSVRDFSTDKGRVAMSTTTSWFLASLQNFTFLSLVFQTLVFVAAIKTSVSSFLAVGTFEDLNQIHSDKLNEKLSL